MSEAIRQIWKCGATKTAKKLLENTNYKVKKVAEKAGLFNYHYFARAFKDLTGLSPLEYRKNNIRQSDT